VTPSASNKQKDSSDSRDNGPDGDFGGSMFQSFALNITTPFKFF
jgi:hypothetical protein